MADKKKIATAAVAVTAAAALLLGGTFAWQSISQTALNEASDIVNPGGRLHDDFDGENKDVYVENFAEEPIFARIRLEEFFEIVLNAGTNGEKTIPVIGTKTAQTDEDGNPVTRDDGTTVYDYEYETYLFDDENFNEEKTTVMAANDVEGTSWWTWSVGGDTVYMPTFNKNKDSLNADINGEYLFETGVITDKDVDGGQYSEMATYDVDDTKPANAIYDIDSNTADEIAQEDLAALIDGTSSAEAYSDYVKLIAEEHVAKETGYGKLISMDEWLALSDYDDEGNYVYNPTTQSNYWVYDEDGWVYWSSPIPAGEATGLLLDGIELNQVMDDSWYYAINVVAQFCTAGDMGTAPEYDDEDGSIVMPGTGFYADDESVSDNAQILLDLIGVNDTTSSDGDDEPEEPENPEGDRYQIHLYTQDEFMNGDASYLEPRYQYTLTAVYNGYDENEASGPDEYEDEDYEVHFSVSIDGMTLIEDEDYSLEQNEFQFEPVEVNNAYTGEMETEYQVEAKLEILNEDLLGEWMTVTVTAPHSSTTKQYVIQYDNIPMTVQLFNKETGEEVTGYIIQPNATYDVKVTAHTGDPDIGDLVIYDTKNSENIAKNITLGMGDNDLLTVYDCDVSSIVDGRLVSGPNPGIMENGDPDGLRVAATVNDLQVLDEYGEIIYRAYASGNTAWLYGYDMVKLVIPDITLIKVSAKEAKTYGVHLQAGIGTAANIPDVIFNVEGSNDTNTKVVKDEDSYQWLILGPNEDASEIKVVATKDGYRNSEPFYIMVDYTDDITTLTYIVEPDDWAGGLKQGESVTIKVNGSYSDGDLTWSEDPDNGHIEIEDHGDGTATLTHTQHTEGECSGGDVEVHVSLTNKSEISGEISINCVSES